MKNTLLITLFAIIISIHGFGQKDSNAKAPNNTDKELNLDLTKTLLEIPEIRAILLTNSYKNADAIFVLFDSRFYEKETLVTTPSTPFYLWNMETLFFNDINHWLIPVSIEKSGNMITYTFKTGSNSSKETHQGHVNFNLANNTWNISSFKIE